MNYKEDEKDEKDINNDYFDELLAGDPIEHLVKILANASLQSTLNSIDKYLEQNAIINLILEERGICIESEINKIKNDINLKDEIKKEKNNIALHLMSDILIQE